MSQYVQNILCKKILVRIGPGPSPITTFILKIDQYNDTQCNDTRFNDTQYNDTQYNDTQYNDNQYIDTQL